MFKYDTCELKIVEMNKERRLCVCVYVCVSVMHCSKTTAVSTPNHSSLKQQFTVY